MLNGYKSYLLAALGVIYAVSGFFTGHIDGNNALALIYAAFSVATLRHGITTSAQQPNN